MPILLEILRKRSSSELQQIIETAVSVLNEVEDPIVIIKDSMLTPKEKALLNAAKDYVPNSEKAKRLPDWIKHVISKYEDLFYDVTKTYKDFIKREELKAPRGGSHISIPTNTGEQSRERFINAYYDACLNLFNAAIPDSSRLTRIPARRVKDEERAMRSRGTVRKNKHVGVAKVNTKVTLEDQALIEISQQVQKSVAKEIAPQEFLKKTDIEQKEYIIPRIDSLKDELISSYIDTYNEIVSTPENLRAGIFLKTKDGPVKSENDIEHAVDFAIERSKNYWLDEKLSSGKTRAESYSISKLGKAWKA